MSINLQSEFLSNMDRNKLGLLLERSRHNPPELEDIWCLMDLVWEEMGCDNRKPDWNIIEEFYNHPVWMLNGLFIEQHDVSMQHRYAITDWIINEEFKSVLDYGGGFGTLSRLIASKDPTVLVDIYEPHPSNYGIERTKKYPNIKFIDSFNQTYDCLVCIDVIEHVSDPLNFLSKIVGLTKKGGSLLIANNFYPVIKCHLPSTFHLRYTFDRFARIMGLEIMGLCNGSHATIYRKEKTVDFNWRKIRFYEHCSRRLFPLINTWRIIKNIK